ncbi:hypothetical protein HDU79_007888 [Rhizoclosmatium sp. JEL0117]|nr:hypothetical protein HDU79_007888 [Rhizoclosmatium sp. JEL0117]
MRTESPPYKALMDLPFDVLVLIVGWLRPTKAFGIAHVSKSFKNIIYTSAYAITTLNRHLTDRCAHSELEDLNEIFFRSPSANYQQVYAAKQSNITTELIFSWVHLYKPIPEPLGQFNLLTCLILKGCNCRGPFPAFVSTLTQLTILILEECKLSGLIPVELGQLTQLEILCLSYNNQLYAPLYSEWGNQLTNLSHLNLSGTGATGPIPREWGNMSKLHTLKLFKTRLNAPIPPELARCTQLKVLDLSYSGTIGLFPSQLQLIPHLDLRGNEDMQIESPLPSQHSRSPIDSLMDLPFDVLVLILGWLDSADAFAIARVSKSVKDLVYSSAYARTALNIHLTDHRSLSDVNDFEEVFFLSPSVQYQEVYAAKKANVTTDLTFAWLRRCGPIPEALGYFRWLEYLTIKSCVCPGPIPSSIITLTELGVLSLEGCRLSGLIPVELGQLTKLEHLSLADNEQLYGLLYPEWGSLTLLHFLDLSGTGVTGLIPPEWGNMGNLHTLILTSTRMSGPIPRELGRCTELQRLELTDSSTIGVIPGELRNVPYLIVEGNDEVIFEV